MRGKLMSEFADTPKLASRLENNLQVLQKFLPAGTVPDTNNVACAGPTEAITSGTGTMISCKSLHSNRCIGLTYGTSCHHQFPIEWQKILKSERHHALCE
jgi:hypothetical protein